MPKSILSLSALLCLGVPAFAVTLTDTTVTPITNGTGLAVASDGRVFVLQQTGQVRLVENGLLQGTPVLDVSVLAGFSLGFADEHGLVGIALDPNFATNGYIYLQYTFSPGGGLVGNRITRFTMGPGGTADPLSQQILLETEAGSFNGHVGGGLAFGPDGKLYTTIGDRRVPASSQNAGDTWGSVLRLNPDGTFAAGTVIPSDNPFCTNPAQLQCAVYVQGLRNPFGVAVNASTGLMFINDAGEQTFEEINAVAGVGVTAPAGYNVAGPGGNFGWPTCEGPCAPAQPGLTDPLYHYSSASGSGNCAITGGTFYNPASPNLPGAFFGDYLFVDYCKGQLTALDFSGPTATTEVLHTLPFGIVALGVAPNGGIYYLGRSTTPGSPTNRLGLLLDTSVPEPSTWMIMGGALLALAVRKRKPAC